MLSTYKVRHIDVSVGSLHNYPQDNPTRFVAHTKLLLEFSTHVTKALCGLVWLIRLWLYSTDIDACADLLVKISHPPPQMNCGILSIKPQTVTIVLNICE